MPASRRPPVPACRSTATEYSRPFCRDTDILRRDLWPSQKEKVAIDSLRVGRTDQLYRGISTIFLSARDTAYFFLFHILSLVIPQHKTSIYDRHLFWSRSVVRRVSSSCDIKSSVIIVTLAEIRRICPLARIKFWSFFNQSNLLITLLRIYTFLIIRLFIFRYKIYFIIFCIFALIVLKRFCFKILFKIERNRKRKSHVRRNPWAALILRELTNTSTPKRYRPDRRSVLVQVIRNGTNIAAPSGSTDNEIRRCAASPRIVA